MKTRCLCFVLLLALCLHAGSCKKAGPPQNVVLVTIDTLRADHLGCYGFGPAQTGNIDRIAAESALFENATSAVPLTLPAHSSIMTGVYPPEHGVRDNGGYYLDDRWQTLAEFLKTKGFATGGFISAFVLDRRWGIAQGFDEYYDHFELSKFKMVSLDSVQRRGDETLGQALKWIDRNKQHRFFAWIHFYDPHTPYDPPEPFKTEFAHPPYGLYDGEIAFTDTLIGRLREALEQQKLLDATLLVITADHGESLGDHGESGHGFFIYDVTTHVPLLIRLPGQTHKQVREQVRSIDLYPTICDALGFQPPSAVKGVSLVSLVEGKSLPETLSAYSESYFARFHYGWSELKSLRTQEYKYISAPNAEFYRLTEDSRERNNLYRAGDQRVSLFESQLTQLLAGFGAAQKPRPMDDESLEKLQALGYIGTASSLAEETGGVLADPKSKIGLYNKVKLAQWKSSEGKNDEARADLLQVLSQDPRILEAQLVLGNLFMKSKQYPEARNTFQKALDVDPKYPAAIFGMAQCYELEGNWSAARAGFERLLELDSRDSKAHFHLGDIALAEKKYDEALTHFQKATDLDDSQATAHNRLGASLLEMKQYDRAQKEFRKALALNERIPNAHFNTGLLLEDRGDDAGAMTEYRKELELFPETYPAHFNLGRIYRKQGNLEAERSELRSCVQQKPDFGIAYVYLAKNLMDGNGDLQEAESLTRQGLASKNLEQEQVVLAHYLLADLYNRLGRPHDAQAQAAIAQGLERKL